jgi:hypothetical protein
MGMKESASTLPTTKARKPSLKRICESHRQLARRDVDLEVVELRNALRRLTRPRGERLLVERERERAPSGRQFRRRRSVDFSG